MVFLGALAISATIGVYSMLPLYLVTERGMSQSDANTWSLSPASPRSPRSCSPARHRPHRTPEDHVTRLHLQGSMTVMLGLASASWISIAVCLQPLISACFFPANFAMLSAIAPQQSRNIAVSLAVPIGIVVGGGLCRASSACSLMQDVLTRLIIVGACILTAVLYRYFLTG